MNVLLEMFDMDDYRPGLEESFMANASMMDGCSGQLSIDTLYENTEDTIVQNPRSQTQGPPDQDPSDIKRNSYPT